jgi:lysophospholipase L1-like esterase
MLLIIILLILCTAFVNGVIFYYNYLAHFHRVHLYGKIPKRFPAKDLIIPAFDLGEKLLKRNELQMYQLLILRHLPVVVCLGDSITHGVISTNWVETLQQQFLGKYLFVNAGINGNLAYNLNSRLKNDCLDFQPDYITILIGTNDVNSQRNKASMKKYMRLQELPRQPDLEFYKQHLREIVTRLKQETKAKIAILSLPVIGEELDSAINLKAMEYSAVIKELAREQQLAYLPLNEIQREFLSRIPHRHPTPFMKKKKLKIISLMIRRSFDKIADLNGYYLTYDGLHATTRGAAIIAGLVTGFLNNKPVNNDSYAPVLNEFSLPGKTN